MRPNHRAIQQRMRLIGVLLTPIPVFLFICLLTYSGNDYPNSSLRPEEALNLGGDYGAWIAYALRVFLGYGAFALPVLLGLLAWNRLTGASARSLFLIPVAGLGLILSGATLFCLIGQIPESGRFAFGGVTGLWLAQNLSGVFGTQGAFFVCGAFFLGVVFYSIIRTVRTRALLRAAAKKSDDPGYPSPSFSRTPLS
ncbi:MAG: DNA translocase FtsK 4TM domain-containing protein [candidate division Zixibacteria bacterium]|nr:DNA translocase FtsK 4TM domain-containing protein [candidate division Zixibacteria bacterium]